MLVLYGDWGSGKTSLMKHIEKEIDKDIYFPIFFHAWEHEKDENLPLSLCDALTSSIDDNSDIIKSFMKGALLTLKSFTSGVTLKAPGFLTGLGLDLEFSGEKYIKAIDEALKETGPISFYKSNKEFKDSFKKIEDLILKKHGSQKILVFVDDLDRCEPENVLNLITALKLFFTYGKNTIYFSAIDKDAVTKAVKTKYHDVIKSEEYMEKVFDLSFNIPKTYSLKKLLTPHFKLTETDLDGRIYPAQIIIEDFFQSIQFTNPRHLKKILNKYKILKSFKSSDDFPNDINKLIPSLIGTQNGKITDTIFCLFMIILYEFYPEKFKEIESYDLKLSTYSEVLYNSQSHPSKHISESLLSLKNTLWNRDVLDSPIYKVFKNESGYGFAKLILVFSTNGPTRLDIFNDTSIERYRDYFTDDTILTRFCNFLIKYKKLVLLDTETSSYVLGNLFSMVKYLL